ncbi:MAG: PDZ domain-containing protein [Deltaproteobacteria bacterium]|nr:MAG: PDZ domain-containing protein [Deltaproteobacteria bacterium]
MRAWCASLLCTILALSACGRVPPDGGHAAERSAATGAVAERPSDVGLDLEHAEYPVLAWAAHMVGRWHHDPDRVPPSTLLDVALGRLALVRPELLARRIPGAGVVEVTVRGRTTRVPVESLVTLTDAAQVLGRVLSEIEGSAHLDAEEAWDLVYDATNALFVALDPHTVLLPPDAFSELSVRTEGVFGGIGAEIVRRRGGVLVASVVEDGPAARAGIVAGDLIRTVDGWSVVGMRTTEVRDLLRGPVGESVDVEVLREGTIHRFSIVRDTIRLPDVASSMQGDRVAYVEIRAFQKGTNERARKAIEDLLAAGATAVVLDLRGNEGGLLTEATDLLDAFVTTGDLVRVHTARGVERAEASEELAVPAQVPVVVLVDERSASAAEVLAGGLAAHDRALVVGRGTFGKGTVQVLQPTEVAGRRIGLKISVAEYRLHGDRPIDGVGLVPAVGLTPVVLGDRPGVAVFHDEERFESRRQRGRLRGVPGARSSATPSGPGVEIAYVVHDAAAGAAMNGDPEVEIATDLAERLRSGSVSDAIAEVAADASARLERVLAERGIDWRDGSSAPPEALEVRIRRSSETPVEAGAAARLDVEIVNRAKLPARRVYVTVKGEHPEIGRTEVLVGRISPGGRKRVRVEVPVGIVLAPAHDELTVAVGAGGRPSVAAMRVPLDLEAAGAPYLVADVRVLDAPTLVPRGHAARVEGNGDGVAAPGERVWLHFDVTNAGDVPAGDVRVRLHPRLGPKAEFDRDEVAIGPLRPGESGHGDVGVALAGASDAAAGGADHLSFDVLVFDGGTGVAFEHRVDLPVHGASWTFVPTFGRVRTRVDAHLLAAAAAQARPRAEIQAGTLLAIRGRVGPYLAVGDRRRGVVGFVPSDLVEAVSQQARPVSPTVDPALVPPRIFVEDLAPRTDADHVVVAGRAVASEGVVDAYVTTRGLRTGAWEEKRDYVSARPGTAAPESLPFRFSVPVAPGQNRIEIVARSRGGVEGRRVVWVYRGDGAAPAVGAP